MISRSSDVYSPGKQRGSPLGAAPTDRGSAVCLSGYGGIVGTVCIAYSNGARTEWRDGRFARSHLASQYTMAGSQFLGRGPCDILWPAALHHAILVSGKGGEREGCAYMELCRGSCLWPPERG